MGPAVAYHPLNRCRTFRSSQRCVEEKLHTLKENYHVSKGLPGGFVAGVDGRRYLGECIDRALRCIGSLKANRLYNKNPTFRICTAHVTGCDALELLVYFKY